MLRKNNTIIGVNKNKGLLFLKKKKINYFKNCFFLVRKLCIFNLPTKKTSVVRYPFKKQFFCMEETQSKLLISGIGLIKFG